MKNHTLQPHSEAFLIGRDEALPSYGGNLTPIVLAGERVSRNHAQVRRLPDGTWTVMDMNSTNGTFLIGRAGKLQPQVAVPLPRDAPSRLFLGGFMVVLEPLGGPNRTPVCYEVDLKDTALLEVRGLTVDKPAGDGGTKRILENVSFTAFPQRVMAIMGGSGTGKSTLLKAINGYEPPTQGSVLLNEKDLYASLDIRQAIGYLPQEDIFHEQLSILEILEATARIRMPALGAAERAQRIEKALKAVDLADPAKDGRLAKVLSGGQRKRLGIAMELLSEPKVLFLDEPTSGLSSEDSYGLLCTLRVLSRQLGTCVLMVIHQPSVEVFKQIDDLVVLKKDKTTPAEMIYAGPAYPDSIQYFQEGVQAATLVERYAGNLSPDVVLLATEGEPEKGSKGWNLQAWRQRWKDSGYEDLHLPVPTTIEARKLPTLRPFGVGQFLVLLGRTLRLKIRDRKTLLVVFLQPLVIGIALAVALGRFQPEQQRVWNHHFFMIFSALWCGAANPPNEIVGEWKIFFRERMVNLKIPSYYLSKVITFLAFSLCQATILGTILSPAWHLQIPLVQTIGILWATAAAGNLLGLLISILASSSEFAVSMVPLPLIIMLLYSGGPLRRLPDMSAVPAALTTVMPSRWSFESLVTLEADAHGETATGWHHDWFDIKAGSSSGQPREDTQRGVDLSTAISALLLWNLVVMILSIGVLKFKADRRKG